MSDGNLGRFCFPQWRRTVLEAYRGGCMSEEKTSTLPPQHQDQQPGIESEMTPKPRSENTEYVGSGKLKSKVAMITGGDSGIGRATAILFAKEGADIAIVYLNEHDDAKEAQRLVQQAGRKCLLIAGDIGDETFCQQAI